MNQGLKSAAHIVRGADVYCHVCSFHLGNKFKDTFSKGLEKGCSLAALSSLSGVADRFQNRTCGSYVSAQNKEAI
jgi:hypothetical protein